jgi:16S rRNA (guanine(966)-N(2))-methyltransferase RsmD
MRIISGDARGRRLFTPKDDKIRPTSDRVKESVFNILMSLPRPMAGAKVLDVFAGTGNLGLEALSRGAAQAVFIDNNRESAALIEKNIDHLGYRERSTVIVREALIALQQLGSKSQFDIVFLDPPYRQGHVERLLKHISQSSLLAESAVVIAELAKNEDLGHSFGTLELLERRNYGDTSIALFAHRGSTTSTIDP